MLIGWAELNTYSKNEVRVTSRLPPKSRVTLGLGVFPAEGLCQIIYNNRFIQNNWF